MSFCYSTFSLYFNLLLRYEAPFPRRKEVNIPTYCSSMTSWQVPRGCPYSRACDARVLHNQQHDEHYPASTTSSHAVSFFPHARNDQTPLIKLWVSQHLSLCPKEAQQTLSSDIFTDRRNLLYRLCYGMSTDLVSSAGFLSYRYNHPLYDAMLPLQTHPDMRHKHFAG